MKKNKSVVKISIKRHLLTLFIGILAPFFSLTIYLLVNLNQLTASYNEIVKNISIANSCNIEWKQKYDYVLYRMIVSSVNAKDAEEKLELQSPYELSEEVITEYQIISKSTIRPEDQTQAENILTLLQTLTIYTQTIDQNISDEDKYDESIQMLDLDIRNLTELILENAQEYINSEVTEMEVIRENLQRSKNNAVTLTFIAICASFFWAIFLIQDMNKNIVEPVTNLYKVTEKVAEGDFTARAESSGDKELQKLNESFNSMTAQLGMLVKNTRMEQINLRKTELKLLQAQINPHFLYNTLDTIIWLSEAGEKKQVLDMVTSLSDFFRTTLSQGRDFVTLREEELHIHSYLEIQKFRYADILDYKLDFPKELEDYTTLKLTLQPIVENALYHGIKYKRGRGMITVRAECVDNHNILFSVIDDGIGMNQDELVKLREVIAGKLVVQIQEEAKGEETRQGIGLRNVNERIRLNYGVEYGITVESNFGEGTIMKVLIPMKKMNEVMGDET